MFGSYRLTSWDALQLLAKRFTDQQVRMVIEFDGRLDQSRLAEAVRVTVAVEPVLGCRVQDRFLRPRWKPAPSARPGSLVRVVAAEHAETEIHRLIVEDLDPLQGPIVRFGLVCGERDALVINLDHTAGDAASVRSLAYLLAAAYERPKRLSAPNRGAYFRKRGFQSLWRSMPEVGRRRRLAMPPSATPCWQFPWGPKATELRKRFLIRRLSPARAAAVRSFATSQSAWLNDVLLTAYFRVLAGLVGEDAGAPRLTVPVDLRSYLPARERPRIANFSSSFDAVLEGGLGRSFDDTLNLVRAATEKQRRGEPGLDRVAVMSSIVDRVPFRLIQRRFLRGRIRMALPPPWFIALGVLRPERLSFGSVAATYAYSLQSFGRAGSVFQLSASSFGETMTLAACFMGDDPQERVVNRFLDLYEAELP